MPPTPPRPSDYVAFDRDRCREATEFLVSILSELTRPPDDQEWTYGISIDKAKGMIRKVQKLMPDFDGPDVSEFLEGAETLSHDQRRQRRNRWALEVKTGNATPEQIAERDGVRLETVRKACDAAKVRYPKSLSGGNRGSTFRLLAQLINTDTPFTELAAQFRVTKQAVEQAHRRAALAGIPVKSRSRIPGKIQAAGKEGR